MGVFKVKTRIYFLKVFHTYNEVFMLLIGVASCLALSKLPSTIFLIEEIKIPALSLQANGSLQRLPSKFNFYREKSEQFSLWFEPGLLSPKTKPEAPYVFKA